MNTESNATATYETTSAVRLPAQNSSTKLLFGLSLLYSYHMNA